MGGRGARTVTLAGPDGRLARSRVDQVAIDSPVDHKLLERRARGPEPSIPQPERAQRRLRVERVPQRDLPAPAELGPAATRGRKGSTGRRAPGPKSATSGRESHRPRGRSRSPCRCSPG